MGPLVTCNGCGWVHFEVSLGHAQSEIDKFNEYYYSQPEEVQASFGGRPSSMRNYDRCNMCGGSYQGFRDFKEGDCPDGCTIGPIIERQE